MTPQAQTEWRAEPMRGNYFKPDEMWRVNRGDSKPYIGPLDKATAHRIAACNEMERALEQAEEWLEGWASAEPYLSEIRAALTKAQPK